MTTPCGPVGRLVEALREAVGWLCRCGVDAVEGDHTMACFASLQRQFDALDEFAGGPPLASDEGLAEAVAGLVGLAVEENRDWSATARGILMLVDRAALGRTPPLPGSK